jgi:hypothetical protein
VGGFSVLTGTNAAWIPFDIASFEINVATSVPLMKIDFGA